MSLKVGRKIGFENSKGLDQPFELSQHDDLTTLANISDRMDAAFPK
jgi:hypothetical protein